MDRGIGLHRLHREVLIHMTRIQSDCHFDKEDILRITGNCLTWMG
jgi:hypothetical protein